MIALRFPYLLLCLLPALWYSWRTPYRWGIPHERPTRRFARIMAHAVPALLAALLVIAAAGPEWRETAWGRAPVVDFAVVLDGSSSMKALDDGQEDRWSAGRRLLKAFIAGRPDDRFALVLFSGHPVTLSPLTADHVRLYTILDRLELSSRDDGTAIGSALMTAVRRLANSPARSRVILLLTDGAQNRGRVTPLEAAEEAKTQGIRIRLGNTGQPGLRGYGVSAAERLGDDDRTAGRQGRFLAARDQDDFAFAREGDVPVLHGGCFICAPRRFQSNGFAPRGSRV